MEDNDSEPQSISQGKMLSDEQAAQIAAHFAKEQRWWVVNFDSNNKPCRIDEYESLATALEALSGRAVIMPAVDYMTI